MLISELVDSFPNKDAFQKIGWLDLGLELEDGKFPFTFDDLKEEDENLKEVYYKQLVILYNEKAQQEADKKNSKRIETAHSKLIEKYGDISLVEMILLQQTIKKKWKKQ